MIFKVDFYVCDWEQSFVPVTVWSYDREQWNDGFVSLCKCCSWKKDK